MAGALVDTPSAGGDVSLQIDRDFEHIVLDEIEQLQPNASRLVISEEIGYIGEAISEASEIVIIDPVDGSKNVAAGIPQFSLSVAVASGPTMADVWFGYVYDFGTKEEHVASTKPLRTGPVSTPSTDRKNSAQRFLAFESAEPALLKAGLPQLRADAFDEIRVIGSIAISLCYLSKGRVAGLVACKGCRSVDAAAGQLIARTAGYEVLFDGRPPEGEPLVLEHEYRVTAGPHDSMQELLAVQEAIPLTAR